MTPPPNGQLKLAELSARQHRVESDLHSCRADNGAKLDRIEGKVDALAAELARFMAAVAAMVNAPDPGKRPLLARWLERVRK